ncbi:MAG TPA: hypothetical protein VLM85_23825 [Polyangiaceae bacterium]|nr:hypothetical protein [Polyangiaceae bacterium]
MRGAWRVLAWCVGGAAVSGGALLACVLADPPPLQQLPPPSRPIIIGSSASPPLGVPISTQPTDQAQLSFAVNVQIDPDQALQYRVFVDYSGTSGVLAQSGELPGSGADGGTPVAFDIFPVHLGDPTQCHTIELDVATQGWFDPSGPSNVAVSPPGGDSVRWIYQPTGNCNLFDAGLFDAGTSPQPDASDGASE